MPRKKKQPTMGVQTGKITHAFVRASSHTEALCLILQVKDEQGIKDKIHIYSTHPQAVAIAEELALPPLCDLTGLAAALPGLVDREVVLIRNERGVHLWREVNEPEGSEA